MRAFAQRSTTAEARRIGGSVMRAAKPHAGFAPKLQRKAACACGGTCPRCRAEPHDASALAIGAPGDAFEQEADRVADQVMRTAADPSGGAAAPATSMAGGPRLQRQASPDVAEPASAPPVADPSATPAAPAQSADATPAGQGTGAVQNCPLASDFANEHDAEMAMRCVTTTAGEPT